MSTPEPPESTEERRQSLPAMDFSMFVVSLGSSANVNLGKGPEPDTGETRVNLTAAKQIIDILGMLEEKTRGNLDELEQKLIKSMLYELRVAYVDAQNKNT